MRVSLWWIVLSVLTGCGRLGYGLLDGVRLDDPAQQDRDAGTPPGDDADGAGTGDGEDPLPSDAGAGDDGGVFARDGGAPGFEKVPLSRACSAASIVIVEDGATTDDASAAGLAAVISAGCLNLGAHRSTVSQDDPGVLEPGSERLLLGEGVVAVVAGGPARHRAADGLNRGASPLYNDLSTTERFRLLERTGDRVVVDVLSSSLDDRHDFVTVMLSVEPRSRTLAFSVFGREQFGTVAATTWLGDHATEIFADDGRTWLVLEWTDDDGRSGPSSGDTFRLVESG